MACPVRTQSLSAEHPEDVDVAKQSPNTPLEGKVSVVGVRPKVSLADRAAPVAELSIVLTGGSGRTAVPITFSIALNVPVSGRPRLTDGDTGAVVAEPTRSGSGYVFKNVPVVPPGSTRTRIFRITNLRGNASAIGVSPALIPSQVVAFVSASAAFRIPLSGSQQNVATISRQ